MAQSLFIGLTRNHTANGFYCHDKPDHGACSACYDVTTRKFEHENMDHNVQHNLNAMRFGDFATVSLVSFLVAVSVGKEVQDIVHCRALRTSHDENVRPSFSRALRALEWIRQFALLPLVVAVVPILVLHRGADALSLCFNTLALLFLLDCDNHAFHALTPRARREAGRLVLSDEAETVREPALLPPTCRRTGYASSSLWYPCC